MPGTCVMDGRQLMDATSTYCSLRCKINSGLSRDVSKYTPLNSYTRGQQAQMSIERKMGFGFKSRRRKTSRPQRSPME